MASWIWRFHLKTKPHFRIMFFLQPGILMASPLFVVSWTDPWLHGHHHTALSTVAGEKLWHSSVTIHTQTDPVVHCSGQVLGDTSPRLSPVQSKEGHRMKLVEFRVHLDSEGATSTNYHQLCDKAEIEDAQMQNTDLEDFCLSTMILHFSCSVTGFSASLFQHILVSSLVQMCHTQRFFPSQ